MRLKTKSRFVGRNMSFLIDWFWDFLFQLGLWKKDATVLLVGLDNSGKSTLLYKLKEGEVLRLAPTQRPREESLELGNVKIRAFDLGGHKVVRDLWQDYFTMCNAVVFLIDLSDDARLFEVKDEFWGLLRQSSPEQLKTTTVLVLGNKCDKPKLVDVDEVAKFLDLDKAKTMVRALQMFKVSLYTGHGYQDALRWLELNV